MDLLRIINGCIAMEQTVSLIYNHYHQLFPEEKQFWLDLSQDEIEHASWLSKASFIEMIDLLPTQDLVPTIDLVENSVRFAESRKKFALTNPITIEDALDTALKLEETMVETFSNELIAHILSVDYESLHDRIIMSEKEHITKIEDMMMKKGYVQLS